MKQKEMREKKCKQIDNLFEWDEIMDIKMFEERNIIIILGILIFEKKIIGKNNWTFDSQFLKITFKFWLV